MSQLEFLSAEVEKLRNAIEKHRNQKADDRCWMDDDELYSALNDGIKCDRRVGSTIAMQQNCERYIRNRCERGGPWKSYVELEAEIKELKRQIDSFWFMVENLWDIEPREFFEKEIADGVGYGNSPLAMAAHYMYKRALKESAVDKG